MAMLGKRYRASVRLLELLSEELRTAEKNECRSAGPRPTAAKRVLVQTLRRLEWTAIMVQDESVGFSKAMKKPRYTAGSLRSMLTRLRIERSRS